MTALGIKINIQKASEILLGLRFEVTGVQATKDEMLSLKHASRDAYTQAEEIFRTLQARLETEYPNRKFEDHVEQAISKLME